MLSDIKASLQENSVGWINAGWYKKGVKIGSSWMTVVGLKKEEGKTILILHDPNPRAGEDAAEEEVILEKVKLTNGNYIYKLAQGMHIKEDADTALLDGLITLDI